VLIIRARYIIVQLCGKLSYGRSSARGVTCRAGVKTFEKLADDTDNRIAGRLA